MTRAVQKGESAMWRPYHSLGLSLAAVLLVSCAKTGVDNKVASTSESAEDAKASSDLIVTGSRTAGSQARFVSFSATQASMTLSLRTNRTCSVH